MCPSGDHIDCLNLIPTYFEFHHFTGINIPFLDQSVPCHNNKKLPLTVVPMLPLCNPRLTDINRNLSTRSSIFIFNGYANFSFGRYVRYKLNSFFAKEPSGIFGIRSVCGCILNCSKRSTISPNVTLCVTGTQQYGP